MYFFKLKLFYCKIQRERFASCVCISISDSTVNWGGHVQGWGQNTAPKAQTHTSANLHTQTHTQSTHISGTWHKGQLKAFLCAQPDNEAPPIYTCSNDWQERDGGRERKTENILPFSVHIFTCSLTLLADNPSSPYCQLGQGFKLQNVLFLFIIYQSP